MTPTPEVRERLRRYLLGQLSDDTRRELEQDVLSSDEAFQELLILEDEMVDQYLSGRLSDTDRAAFEQHFLATPERHEKLKFSRAFSRYVSSHAAAASAAKQTSSSGRTWVKPLFSSPLRIAAVAILIVGAALGIWRIFFHQSEVDKGLVALNRAYREQRPVESRISRLDYAPYLATRGPGTEKIDQNELRRAELTLLDARARNPTPAVHHALGKVYLAEKEFDDAIKEFEEALKGDPKNAQIYSDLGAAWMEKAKSDLEKDNSKAAGEFGRSHENLIRSLELNEALLEAIFNRALCRQYLKLTQQAADDWRNYIKRDPNSPWAAEARRNLTILEQQTAMTGDLFRDFLNAYDSRDDPAAWAALKVSRMRAGNSIVETLLDQFLNHSANGQTNAAAADLQILSYAGKLENERAADRYTLDLAGFYNATRSEDRELLHSARTVMGEANRLYRAGEFDKAAQLYAEARNVFVKAADDCESLLAESLIGYCSVRNSDAAKASKLFQRLAETFESRHYLSLACQSWQAVGDAESSLHEFSRTLDFANRALNEAQQIEDNATAVHCLAQLLSTYLALGDYDRSLEYFGQAIGVSEKLPRDPTLIWPIYYDAGLDFHFLGMPETAVGFEKEAFGLANEAGVALLRSRSWERLGVLSGERKKYDEAVEFGKRALAESQNISSPRARTNMSAHSLLRLGQLNNQAGNPGEALNYFARALELYEQLDSQVYLYEAEKGRLIAHVQLSDDVAVSDELPKVVNLFEENREKIADESDRDKFFDAGQSTYDIAIDYSYRKQGAEAALAYAEASRARSLFELMHTGARLTRNSDGESRPKIGAESKSLSPAAIREKLPEQSQLIEYSVLDDKVIIWVITRSLIQSEYRTIAAPELEAKVQTFVQALSHVGPTNQEDIKPQAKDLYTTLIAPVEKYLDPNLFITVVPDQGLNYLPFEALISPISGHYLVEDYALERSPSATIFIESSMRANKLANIANERLLSVGNPKFDRVQFGSLPDLPAAAREAEQIAAFYYPETHLIGANATFSQVSRVLAGADVIHLATHAVADERSPLLSKLLMTPDGNVGVDEGVNGVLRATDIYEMKLPHTRLVVLSACSTGVERAYRGEGAIGLARPFMAAGVPIVVASLWPVDSDATADFMINFHRHRKDKNGASTVQALRLAQLDAIHNTQTNSENFVWAAFVAIGGYAEF